MNVSDLLRGKASPISKIIFHHRIDRGVRGQLNVSALLTGLRGQMNVSDLLRGEASQISKNDLSS